MGLTENGSPPRVPAPQAGAARPLGAFMPSTLILSPQEKLEAVSIPGECLQVELYPLQQVPGLYCLSVFL